MSGNPAHLSVREAFQVVWNCADPKCCLCAGCVHALRRVMEERRRGRPKAFKELVGPNDPIRTFRARGVNARKA